MSKQECYNCGCDIDPTGPQIEHEGECYCEDCFYELFYICDNCGRYEDIDNVRGVLNERGDTLYWCSDCLDNDANYCDCCDDYYDYDLTETHDGTYVCNDCLDNYYTYCDNCDQYYHNNDVIIAMIIAGCRGSGV